VTPDTIAPPFFLAAALLIVSGALKVVRPRATAQAMLDVGLPGSVAVGRGLGALEVAVAAWAIVAPRRGGAVALAVAYLAFATFLGYVLRRHPDAGSCGCAGAKAVPPSRLHLTLDLVAAVSGVAYAVVAGPAATAWLARLGPAAAVVVAGLTLAGWLAAVAVTEAPAAWRAWAPPEHVHDPHRSDDHDRSAEVALASAGIGPGHPSLWPETGTPA
jgi:Methylamine utilisation protein MauE